MDEKNVLHFEPQVLASWQSFQVEHVRVGNSVVDLSRHSENAHFTLDLQSVGPMFHLNWNQARTSRNAIPSASLDRDIMPGKTHLSIP